MELIKVLTEPIHKGRTYKEEYEAFQLRMNISGLIHKTTKDMTPSGVVLNTFDVIYKYEIPPGFNIILDINC